MTAHGLYRQVVFIWRLLLFYFIKKGLLKCGFYLQVGLYMEVVFNTSFTVHAYHLNVYFGNSIEYGLEFRSVAI